MYNMIGITWKNFVDDDIVKNYDVITFIVKYLYFKKDWSSQFCWHHQNCNGGYQKISKNSKKSKQLPKMLSVFVFSDVAKFANFLWKNSHVNRTQRVCRCPPPPSTILQQPEKAQSEQGEGRLALSGCFQQYFVHMSVAFHENLTSFFKYSCYFNETIGAILVVQVLQLYSAAVIC